MNLVTGATGILGSHVVLQLLLDGQPVVAARRSGSNFQRVRDVFRFYSPGYASLFDKIRWIELDVLDYAAVEEALQGISVVYHCAGFVSFDPADRKKLFRINEEGTKNVVNACLHTGGVRLCHTSTIGAISNSDLHELDESVFWKKGGAESDYALSKYNAEREVWRGMEEGLDAVIVNPGVILAPVFWEQSSGKIFHRCFKGNVFYTAGSSAYISAMDCARAMVQLVNGCHFGNRYILAEGNYDFSFILGRIQRNFKKRPPFVGVPRQLMFVAVFFARIFSVFRGGRRILTKPLVIAAYNRQLYSNKKVKSVPGIQFEPVPAVIDKVCGYYQTVSGTIGSRP